jgi:hypothetical protein
MNANDDLSGFTGTEQYYSYLNGTTLTDGSKALAEKFKCWWLLDVIASYQKELQHEEFQVWMLTVNDDKSALVQATDGNHNVLRQQIIPFTDFPMMQ